MKRGGERIGKDLVAASATPLVLAILQRGASYGYAIIQQVRELSVKGRNLSEGVPRSFTLNSNEILEALQEPLQGIVGAVKQALEQTPPELGADVAERGISLA